MTVAKVKLALRINHTYLDSDINDTINTAKAEMVRAGVDESIANSNLDIVQRAILTYCQYIYANSKTVDGYFESWTYQLDCIRKSSLVVPESTE